MPATLGKLNLGISKFIVTLHSASRQFRTSASNFDDKRSYTSLKLTSANLGWTVVLCSSDYPEPDHRSAWPRMLGRSEAVTRYESQKKAASAVYIRERTESSVQQLEPRRRRYLVARASVGRRRLNIACACCYLSFQLVRNVHATRSTLLCR